MPVSLRKKACSNTSITPSSRGDGSFAGRKPSLFIRLKFVFVVVLSAPVVAPLLFRILDCIFQRSCNNSYNPGHMIPNHHHPHSGKQRHFDDIEQQDMMDWEASMNTADSELSLLTKEDDDDAFDHGPAIKKTKAKRSTMPPTITILQAWTDPLPPKMHPDLVRCVILSDTHGLHWDLDPLPLPRGDVLIHLGDVANRGSVSDVRSFVDFIVDQQAFEPFKDIVFIEGNHDRDLTHPGRLNLVEEYRNVGTLLKDQVVRVAQGKLSLLGVSWSACERQDFSQAMRASEGQQIDMLLTHCPPSTRHVSDLERFSQSLGAPLHLSGHIHKRRGIIGELPPRSGDALDATSTNRSTIKINCSSIPANRPVVLDWHPDEKRVVMIHCPCPSRY